MLTSIIAAACSLALGTTALSAQADTTDVYIINGENIEHFDGSQLVGKTVSAYKVTTNKPGTKRIHFIETSGKQINGIRVYQSERPATDEEIKSISSVTITSDGSVKTASLGAEVINGDNMVFLLNGKEITSEEFGKIKPNKIKGITVLKDAESITKYGYGEDTKAILLVETK